MYIKELIIYLRQLKKYLKEKGIKRAGYVYGGEPFTYTSEPIDEIIKGLKILENFIEKLHLNPYPEDIFLPIPKEDFNKINDLLKKEMGYSIDRLSGNMGRKLYKSIIENLEEVIK